MLQQLGLKVLVWLTQGRGLANRSQGMAKRNQGLVWPSSVDKILALENIAKKVINFFKLGPP